MNLISLGLQQPEKRANPLQNPAVPLSSPEAWAWITGGGAPTAAGEYIDASTALQQETVLACVNLLGNAVSALPLLLHRKTETGRTEATDDPLHQILSAQPNADMTNVDFFFAVVANLALHGNSYSQITRENGQVTGLWPLSSVETHPIRLPNGRLAYKTTDGETDGRSRTLNSEDVLHVKWLSLDGVLGLSPIEQARQSIGLARAAQKFGARMFANNATPSLAIEVPEEVDPKTKALMRAEWESMQGGHNVHRVAVLDQGMKVTPFSISPEDAQFLATRQFERASIAAIFNINPIYIGELTKASGSNAEQMSLDFMSTTLAPWLARIEAEISRKLLSKDYVAEFDTSQRLRGDLLSLSTAIATGVYAGYLSRNDGRRMMRLNIGPPELDQFLEPTNYRDAGSDPSNPYQSEKSQRPSS